MMRKRASVSDWVSAAVGSSKMMTLQFTESALTISTTCCCDTERPETCWRGSMWACESKSASSRRVCSLMRRKPTSRRFSVVQRVHEDVLGHAHVLAER